MSDVLGSRCADGSGGAVKFVVFVDGVLADVPPPGLVAELLQEAWMAQLEREFLYGTSVTFDMTEVVEGAMRKLVENVLASPEGMHILNPPRRKGPPSRDARKDRWR